MILTLTQLSQDHQQLQQNHTLDNRSNSKEILHTFYREITEFPGTFFGALTGRN